MTLKYSDRLIWVGPTRPLRLGTRSRAPRVDLVNWDQLIAGTEVYRKTGASGIMVGY